MRIPAERQMTVGATLSSLGGSGAIAYFIFVSANEDESFWRLPGFAALAVLLLGLVILAHGLTASPTSAEVEPHGRDQRQTSGDDSVNVQAGRDVRIRDIGSLKDRN